MNESQIIKYIQTALKSDYIGDDCACLRDLGIVMTQDSLVEDVHFKTDYASPYSIGYKSVAVNMSDIYASGADPAYITIALSMPSGIEDKFVPEFIKGCRDAAFPAQIVGGDITKADKIYISICAIGRFNAKRISSRSNAKVGYKIITSGFHGSSSAGLYLLANNLDRPQKFIDAHLLPKLPVKFSLEISSKICDDYAMMDTSDGLADALLKIAKSSNVKLCVDFDKIPYDKDLEKILPDFYKHAVMFGGEDYQLVACVPDYVLKEISNYSIIGEVKEKLPEDDFVEIKMGDIIEKWSSIDNMLFQHFETHNVEPNLNSNKVIKKKSAPKSKKKGIK